MDSETIEPCTLIWKIKLDYFRRCTIDKKFPRNAISTTFLKHKARSVTLFLSLHGLLTNIPASVEFTCWLLNEQHEKVKKCVQSEGIGFDVGMCASKKECLLILCIEIGKPNVNSTRHVELHRLNFFYEMKYVKGQQGMQMNPKIDFINAPDGFYVLNRSKNAVIVFGNSATVLVHALTHSPTFFDEDSTIYIIWLFETCDADVPTSSLSTAQQPPALLPPVNCNPNPITNFVTHSYETKLFTDMALFVQGTEFQVGT